MGWAGIPVWCYEWMTDFNWARTGTSDSRGGSVVTRFDLDEVSLATTHEGSIWDEELWDNLKYLLRRVIPAT